MECTPIALKKIIFHLKENKMSDPRNLYPVMELETMHFDLFKYDNIHHKNRTTTFADLLIKYVPDLNKKTANKQVSVIFDTVSIALNTSSETYFDSIERVTGSVRKAMHWKCQENYSSLNVDLQSQLDSVNIELVQLINFLQDVIDLDDKGYSSRKKH